MPTEEALALIQRNLTSLGRYNDTPFLLPLYGASELSQAFARYTPCWTRPTHPDCAL